MKNGKILIIDDDDIISLAMAKRLNKREYETERKKSGKDILAELLKAPSDLILLDIKMPDISGIDVLKLIRTQYKKNLLPIIMCSSCDEDNDVINALKLGANDYVTKPVNIDVLISRIDTQLELKNLSLEFARKEQLEAITAMITTYNHEINNSLAISMGQLTTINKKKYLPEDVFAKLHKTQERIHDIVKKINKISEDNEVNFESYSGHSKMVKIR